MGLTEQEKKEIKTIARRFWIWMHETGKLEEAIKRGKKDGHKKII